MTGVDIGGLSRIILFFAGVRVVGGCVLVYACTHTQTTWVLGLDAALAHASFLSTAIKTSRASVAQLVRARDCQSLGRRFDSV